MTSPKALALDKAGVVSASRLLSLPDELQEKILMQAGAGGFGAYAACQDLRAKFQRAILMPSTASIYFISRYSRSRTAIVGAYVSVLNHLQGAFREHDVLPLVTRLSSLGCGLSPPVLTLAGEDLRAPRALARNLPSSLSPAGSSDRGAVCEQQRTNGTPHVCNPPCYSPVPPSVLPLLASAQRVRATCQSCGTCSTS